MIDIHPATAQELPAVKMLFIEHSRNPWSYPTDEWISEHFSDIANDKAHAIVASEEGVIIGAVTFELNRNYLKYQPETEQNDHGYINEVVVNHSYTKKGIGTDLLRTAVHELFRWGVKTIYAKRHEENLPSARIMEKCGFRIIDVYSDNERTSGSLKTALCRLTIENFNGRGDRT